MKARLALAAVVLLASPAAADPVASPKPSPKPAVRPTPKPTPAPLAGPFLGKYESGWNKVPSLELVVAQRGQALRGGLTLVADHRGARVLTVDLTGKAVGRAAQFRWEDAYGNAGTATLWRRGQDAWRLDAIIKRPTDQGRWFEGHYDLKKTADVLEPGQEPL